MKLKKEYLDKLLWFRDSPDAGLSECICSLCRKVISAGEIPIRFFGTMGEARFHEYCFTKVVDE